MLIVSFANAKLLNLIGSHLFFLFVVFISVAQKEGHKYLAVTYVKEYYFSMYC